MKCECISLLAHVDAGKTTLSEAMLYRCGQLKKLGRVDHQDAFLDNFALERERGITIFSKQAVLPLGGVRLTVLDTPGHVDFSSEMERTLQVLDYAILVISGTDGVQSHTETLWRLLKRYEIPTLLFINKMDLDGADREALLAELKHRLDGNCIPFGEDDEAFFEEAAMCAEELMEEYLSVGTVQDAAIINAIRQRQIFPCYFGSALKLTGVDELLRGLERYTTPPEYPEEFGAKVYKIARDSQGNRLTYLKVTGGSLRVKAALSGTDRSGAAWTEKVEQIRLYSGAKFTLEQQAEAGAVCAVTGLSHTVPGQGLGIQPDSTTPLLESVLTYQVMLNPGTDPHTAFLQLKQLEEEDPQLHLVWAERTQQLHIQLMGQVQLEVIQRVALDRFGLDIHFGTGAIVYRETIAAPVIGGGHFEPLRHYAEVQLLLEPSERGCGLTFDSICSEDVLDKNWQRLILTHLEEKEHLGVLTGSPITDMKLTLLTGKAHIKHTEGGDFRQATYRAVRQGLMEASSVLLEPWYDVRLELPQELLGRAMSDLQLMEGSFEAPEIDQDTAVLTGSVPVASLGEYQVELASYTKGRGRMSCSVAGYRPCHNTEEVVASIGYDPESDVENTPDSVFCSHGAGTIVKWNQVKEQLHTSAGIQLEQEKTPMPERTVHPERSGGSLASDAELQAIFERTYGAVKPRAFEPPQKPRKKQTLPEKQEVILRPIEQEYLLVDGYNIIFAWEELKRLARQDLDAARQQLTHKMCNYQGVRNCKLILVFDAYKVENNPGSVEKVGNISVVYTKQAETADMYIEKVTYEIGKHHRVRVATSDGMEQLIILGHGAVRISASAFQEEVKAAEQQLATLLEQYRG